MEEHMKQVRFEGNVSMEKLVPEVELATHYSVIHPAAEEQAEEHLPAEQVKPDKHVSLVERPLQD
jgi:hypothetical protein